MLWAVRRTAAAFSGYGSDAPGQRSRWAPPGGALPEDKTLTFALAGNQNCGKTTLFNQLTGSNQHVGNFPGVTVDQKRRRDHPGQKNCSVVDLPGIYSMPLYQEEIVTRDFILERKAGRHHQHCGRHQHRAQPVPDMQLMELRYSYGAGAEHDGRGARQRRHHRVNKMEAMLGIPVVPISAAKSEGVDELVNQRCHVAK